MNILISGKISHLQEIDKILKINKHNLAEFPILRDCATELDTLKSQISFASTKDVPVQKANTTTIQEKMETYIKLLFNISLYIEIPKKKDFYNFEWKGNIKKGEFVIRDFYYEISAVFFNLAVVYFNQAYGLLKGEKLDELKLALKYFRSALWSFNESNKSIRKSFQNGTPVPELSFSYIQACFNTCSAYGYRTLYLILKPNFSNFSADQQLSFHKSAYESYEKVNKSIDESKNFPFCCGEQEKIRLANYQIFHFLSTLYKRAKDAELAHKEKLTGGFNGQQIAFLEWMKGPVDDFKKNIKVAVDQETADLIKSAEIEIAKLKDLKLENDQVYSAKIPAIKDLPQIVDSEYKVMPLDQPHVKTKDERLTPLGKKLKSSEFKNLENDFELVMNKNKQNLNALIENVQKTKIGIYQKENIDVLLRIADSNGESIELDTKLKEITQVNGGSTGYKNAVESLKKFSESNDFKTRELKKLIEEDVKADRLFLTQFGYKLFGLDIPGNQLVSGFEKHGIALTSLRQKDQELMAEFPSILQILTKIENGSLMEELKNMKDSIVQSDELANLVKKDKMIQEIIRLHLKPTEQTLNDYIEKSNTKALIQEIFFNNKTTDEIYKQINENVSNKIEEFRDMIEGLVKALNKMKELAQSINSKMGSSANSLGLQQRILSDVNNAQLYYTLVLKNNVSNESLFKNGEFLEQILKDYLLSKELQKEEILKNLNAFQNLNLGDFGGSLFNQSATGFYNNAYGTGPNQQKPSNQGGYGKH